MMLWNIGMVMLILGVILLVVSLILVFTLKIPDLLDELSGKKAKRQIKRLKELNIGTGSLEGVTTDEFYMSLSSSGHLLSEDYLFDNKPKNNKQKELKPVKKEDSYNEEEESKTQYMDIDNDEDSPTGFIQDDDVTGMLDEVNDFIHTKHVINVIEEQSSLE